jgi:hypothetical protein
MIKILLLVFSLFFLSGCTDPITDVFNFISDFYTAYLANIVCWIMQTFIDFIQLVVDDILIVLGGMFSILPTVTLPTINPNDLDWLRYAAYFLPISEAATLLKYFFYFFITFSGVRFLGRWLKVWK